MSKDTIRRKIISLRDALSVRHREVLSLCITKRLLNWELYRQARVILMYGGVRSEVGTEAIVRKSFAQGKRIAMPRCVASTRDLLLLEIHGWSDLKPSFYGLLEPNPAARPIPATELDLVLVPGVAFTRDGFRIGYGGGYYDRLLSRLPNVVTIGLAFQLQIVDYFPIEEHDKPVDYLFTEEGLTACRPIGQAGEGRIKR